MACPPAEDPRARAAFMVAILLGYQNLRLLLARIRARLAHLQQLPEPMGDGQPPNAQERLQQLRLCRQTNSILPFTLAGSATTQASQNTSNILPSGRLPYIPAPTTTSPHDRWPKPVKNNGQQWLKNLRWQEEINGNRMTNWLKDVALQGTYNLNCSFGELDARPDNQHHYFDASLATIALQDPSVPARSTSGRWYGKNDQLMVAYFAGSNHGIPKRVLERKHWHTQKFFSLQDQSRPPALSDNRHLSDAHSPSFFYTKEGESEPYAEPKGLRHDLELRFEQGHQHDRSLVPSTELMGSGSGRRHLMVRSHIMEDEDLAAWLDHMFETACPEEYAKEKKAYDAGHWVMSEEKFDLGGIKWNGPLPKHRTGWALNRVTLYKLHTGLHRDRNDSWCCILNSGSFTGGHALFPDLGLKLNYAPGDVIFFRSSALYHTISPWKAGPMKDTDKFTPGRIAYVYYNYKAVNKVLETKEAGWIRKTAGLGT